MKGLQCLFDTLRIAPVLGEDQSLGFIGTLAQNKYDFLASSGREVQMDLIDAARVDSAGGLSAQAPAAETVRPCQIGLGPEKFPPVSGESVRFPARGEERASVGKIGIPVVVCQQRLHPSVIAAANMWARHAWQRAKQPFGIVGCGQSAMLIQQVANTKSYDFDRGVGRNEDEHFLFKAVRVFVPCAVARAVPDLASGIATSWGRGHAPHRRCFFIAQVQYFGRPVGHGVVRPGADPVFAAVDSPAEATSRLGDKTAEPIIGKNVGPWRGCRLFRSEMNDIFAPVSGKAAYPVVEQEIGWAFGRGNGRVLLGNGRNEER